MAVLECHILAPTLPSSSSVHLQSDSPPGLPSLHQPPRPPTTSEGLCSPDTLSPKVWCPAGGCTPCAHLQPNPRGLACPSSSSHPPLWPPREPVLPLSPTSPLPAPTRSVVSVSRGEPASGLQRRAAGLRRLVSHTPSLAEAASGGGGSAPVPGLCPSPGPRAPGCSPSACAPPA